MGIPGVLIGNSTSASKRIQYVSGGVLLNSKALIIYLKCNNMYVRCDVPSANFAYLCMSVDKFGTTVIFFNKQMTA